ncbi:MAG: hypothetical protein ACI4C5_03735 [Lachnospiraceae bacterium]
MDNHIYKKDIEECITDEILKDFKAAVSFYQFPENRIKMIRRQWYICTSKPIRTGLPLHIWDIR